MKQHVYKLIVATAICFFATGISNATDLSRCVDRDDALRITYCTNLIQNTDTNFVEFGLASYFRGEDYYFENEYEKAIEHLSRAIEFGVTMSDVYWLRGRAHYFLGHYEKSIADFDVSIDFYPTASDYAIRGLANEKLEDYDQAISDYSEAISRNSTYIPPFIYRGLIYEKLEEFDLAIADFDHAISVDPSSFLANEGRQRAIIERDEARAQIAAQSPTTTDAGVVTAQTNTTSNNAQIAFASPFVTRDEPVEGQPSYQGSCFIQSAIVQPEDISADAEWKRNSERDHRLYLIETTGDTVWLPAFRYFVGFAPVQSTATNKTGFYMPIYIFDYWRDDIPCRKSGENLSNIYNTIEEVYQRGLELSGNVAAHPNWLSSIVGGE